MPSLESRTPRDTSPAPTSLADRLSKHLRHLSLVEVFWKAVLVTAKRLFGLQVYRVVWLEKRDLATKVPTLPDGYHGRFLDLNTYEVNPNDDTAARMVRYARGVSGLSDRCYGIFHRDRLVNFCLYSRRPDRFEGMEFIYTDHYLYFHGAYTHPDHRGLRLLFCGVTTALTALVGEGFHGALGLVAANNHRSIRASSRIGFRVVGSFLYRPNRGSISIFATPGARAAGVDLVALTGDQVK